jgi:hypothetical protein
VMSGCGHMGFVLGYAEASCGSGLWVGHVQPSAGPPRVHCLCADMAQEAIHTAGAPDRPLFHSTLGLGLMRACSRTGAPGLHAARCMQPWFSCEQATMVSSKSGKLMDVLLLSGSAACCACACPRYAHDRVRNVFLHMMCVSVALDSCATWSHTQVFWDSHPYLRCHIISTPQTKR